MKAFIRFHKGILKMPIHWQLWLGLLVAANLIALLFFLHHFEARVVLGTIMASMMLMTLLTAGYGLWIRALIVLNSLSLLTDAVDVIRYIAGDRAETVRGL